jgi:hypothetical protein
MAAVMALAMAAMAFASEPVLPRIDSRLRSWLVLAQAAHSVEEYAFPGS